MAVDLFSFSTPYDITRVYTTEALFESVELTVALNKDANPALEGVVDFGGSLYTIRNFELFSSGEAFHVRYMLVPEKFYTPIEAESLDDYSRILGMKSVRKVGAVDFVPYGGVTGRTVAYQFADWCSRNKFIRQVIVDVSNGETFIGNPSQYPRETRSDTTYADIVFNRAFGSPGEWSTFRGEYLSLSNTQGFVQPWGAITPTLTNVLFEITLPNDVLKWGVKYVFDNIPLFAGVECFVYAKVLTVSAERNVAVYTMAVLGKEGF